MRIAIDLDGVVFNSDMFFMAMGEIYDCSVLKRNSMVWPEEARVQERYCWSSDEISEYINRYSCSDAFSIMPCASIVIDELKNNPENEIIFVSARGQFSEEEIAVAEKKLKETGITAHRYFWSCTNKAAFCAAEKVDILIDDDFRIHAPLTKTDVTFLYFHMAGKRELPQGEKLHVVHNWGEVYRILHQLKAL